MRRIIPISQIKQKQQRRSPIFKSIFRGSRKNSRKILKFNDERSPLQSQTTTNNRTLNQIKRNLIWWTDIKETGPQKVNHKQEMEDIYKNISDTRKGNDRDENLECVTEIRLDESQKENQEMSVEQGEFTEFNQKIGEAQQMIEKLTMSISQKQHEDIKNNSQTLSDLRTSEKLIEPVISEDINKNPLHLDLSQIKKEYHAKCSESSEYSKNTLSNEDIIAKEVKFSENNKSAKKIKAKLYDLLRKQINIEKKQSKRSNVSKNLLHKRNKTSLFSESIFKQKQSKKLKQFKQRNISTCHFPSRSKITAISVMQAKKSLKNSMISFEIKKRHSKVRKQFKKSIRKAKSKLKIHKSKGQFKKHHKRQKTAIVKKVAVIDLTEFSKQSRKLKNSKVKSFKKFRKFSKLSKLPKSPKFKCKSTFVIQQIFKDPKTSPMKQNRSKSSPRMNFYFKSKIFA